MASYWNIPILSGVSTSPVLSDKVRHTRLTRLSYDLNGMTYIMTETFKRFNWTRLVNEQEATPCRKIGV